MTDDRMNPTDATLWEIKRDPELRTTIVALATLDRVPEREALVASVERAIESTPRLRQRVVEGPLGMGRPRWVDADVDLAFHVRRVALPQPATTATLLELIRPLAGEDFDVERPLWQITAIDGLPDGKSALVLKVSHSLTDGIGGMSLLNAFADLPTTSPHHEPSAPVATRAHHSSVNPLRGGAEALRMVRSAGRLMAPSGDPLSPLFTERSIGRWLGVTQLRFDPLRHAASRAGGTINDAFVTIALLALADYHRTQGSDAGPLRVTMPVSFRRDEDPDTGNQWTPSRFVATVDPDAHPFDTLHDLRSILHRSSHEPAIGIAQTLVAGLQELPAGLTTSVVAAMVKGSDVVLTDVPGPAEATRIAGVPVESIHPFAPTGGAALSIGLVTYNGMAHIGFTVDPAAVAEPERVVGAFERRAADFVRRRRRTKATAKAETQAETPAAVAPSGSGSSPDTEQARRLSALDTSFLRMESPRTPMHMGSLLILDGAPLMNDVGELDVAAIRRRVAERLALVPRLTRKVKEVPLDLGRPVWVDDPSFDVAEHVRVIRLPSPGTREQLIERCELLQMQLLPRSRPLFEFWFVVGLDPETFGPNRVAVIEKLHHALVDGMSGVELASVLFDREPLPLGSEEEPLGSEEEPLGSEEEPLGSEEEPFGSEAPSNWEPSGPELAVGAVVEQLRKPWQLLRWAGETVQSPAGSATQLARAGAAASDLTRPLLGARIPKASRASSQRRLLASVSIPLDQVHDTALALGATVNDVVLASVACGFGDLFAQRGTTAPHPFTAMVPVSTRHDSLASQPGNQVSALLIELPIGADPVDAVAAMSDAVTERKKHHYPEGTGLLIDAADLLPPVALRAVPGLMAHQPFVDVVVTNMPGPRRARSFAGATIEEMIPIVPLGPNLPVSIAVLSYAGSLTIALHADAAVCPDVEVLAAGIVRAFGELAAAQVIDAV